MRVRPFEAAGGAVAADPAALATAREVVAVFVVNADQMEEREADGELQTTALEVEDGLVTAIHVMRNPESSGTCTAEWGLSRPRSTAQGTFEHVGVATEGRLRDGKALARAFRWRTMLDGRQPAELQLDDLLEGSPVGWEGQEKFAQRGLFVP